MLSEEQAREFAEEWVNAWNARDIDGILAHYAEDVELTSPFAATMTEETSGTLRGKQAVREYWEEALKRIPDLRFELLDVFVGVNSVVLHYEAIFGKLGADLLIFDDNGKVVRGISHYNNL